MTPQEQQLLQGLTDRVNQTQLTDKDPDAEKFIFEHLGRNSDSLYILSQTVIVQQYALDNATKQIADLKQQIQQAQQQPVKHTSFLGSLLGGDSQPAQPSRPAPPPPPPPQPQYSQAQYVPVPTYSQPQVVYAEPVGYGYGSPYGGMGMGGGMGQGGFLRGAMQTAAGVAAGAIAFEGIESLMHGFGEHAGYGSGFEGMGGGRPEEIINNNYYGDSAGDHNRGDLTDRFAAAGDQPSPDVEDRRFDSGSDAPADDTTQADDSTDNFADDSGNNDDTGSDSSDNFDSGADDSGGGFDNGGSDDSGF